MMVARYENVFDAFCQNGRIPEESFDMIQERVVGAYETFLKTSPSDRKTKYRRIDKNLKEVAAFEKNDPKKATMAAQRALLYGSAQAAKWLENYHETVTQDHLQITFYRVIQIEMDKISVKYPKELNEFAQMLQKISLELQPTFEVLPAKAIRRQEKRKAIEDQENQPLQKNQRPQKRIKAVPLKAPVVHRQEAEVKAPVVHEEKQAKMEERAVKAVQALMSFKKGL